MLTMRTLLALRPKLYLKGDELIDLRSATSRTEGFDVDEDVLPALSRLDEAESAFVVPGFERAFEAHGCWFARRYLELSGRQRQDAKPRVARIYRAVPDRAW